MIPHPPSALSDAEVLRLEPVALPAPDDEENICVYRFSDTLEYLAEDDETASAIQQAFPAAKIRRV